MALTEEQIKESEELRNSPRTSLRPVSEGAEKHLHVNYEVLDHGVVRLVDYMGNDEAVCQAARVSYGRGTKSVSNDAGLINYLVRHYHSTPLEMCEAKFHVKLPVFVARQWIRHRTANVNEYSARYSILDKEFYVPAPENLAAQSSVNNQGRGEVLTGREAQDVLDLLREDAMRSYDHYEEMLRVDEDKKGLARELARMNLPMNVYTQWYWKTDLHNLLHFLRLRVDHHAQYEIRVYGEKMSEIVKDWVPLCWDAFENFRLHQTSFSRKETEILARMLRGEEASVEDSGLSKGEQREFNAKIEKLIKG